jgi:hypothetical protein
MQLCVTCIFGLCNLSDPSIERWCIGILGILPCFLMSWSTIKVGSTKKTIKVGGLNQAWEHSVMWFQKPGEKLLPLVWRRPTCLNEFTHFQLELCLLCNFGEVESCCCREHKQKTNLAQFKMSSFGQKLSFIILAETCVRAKPLKKSLANDQ